MFQINVIEAKKKTDIVMAVSLHQLCTTLKGAALPCRLCDPVRSRQMLSLMEAQAQLFQHGHQSLSQLDEYRRQLNEEVTETRCLSPPM